MISKKDYMHGAALISIADSKGFTALNKSSDLYGHYTVNHDRQILIKYARSSGEKGDFHFTVKPSDFDTMRHVRGHGKDRIFVVLVCGEEAIIALTLDEIEQAMGDPITASRLTVNAQPNKQLRVRGRKGSVGPIPRKSFPIKIFQ